MKIALAQVNSTLGAFQDNADKIIEYWQKAADLGADIVVFPEASLFGYHPVDLLERPNVVDEQEKELKRLAKVFKKKGPAVLLGAIVKNPAKNGKPFLNAAVFFHGSSRPKVFAKELLPTYDVFDEARHIQPGRLKDNVFRFKGQRILVTICEDIWGWSKDLRGRPIYARNPIADLKPRSVDLILNLSASPFTENKLHLRQGVVSKTARHLGAPMVYVNLVGAQDELIFDGGSYVVSKTGRIQGQCQRFVEDLMVYDLETGKAPIRVLDTEPIRMQRQAIRLGLRDFVQKVGLNRVHLGLSGGIDSAVVACLAVEALGKDAVTAIALPGPYSTPASLRLAQQLSRTLGVELKELSIDSTYAIALEKLQKSFGLQEFGLPHENLQARLRGLFLMAFSNIENSLLLNTSNKSEFAMGYTTLYGDLCGALSPIGDLLKSEVFAMAEEINKESEVIPAEIITRPPSAELRPDQRDDQSLPPYEELDPAVTRLVENFSPPKSALDKRVLLAMMKSEFKRWQAPPVLKLSDHAFGRGRRFPIAHRAWF